MDIQYHKGTFWCIACGDELLSTNTLILNGNIHLEFCEECMVDLRELILQKCCVTEKAE